MDNKHERIATYIQTHGMAMFNSIDMKILDKPLYYDITKRLGGFKKLKAQILEGTIVIPGYNLAEESTEITEFKEEVINEIIKPPVNEVEKFEETSEEEIKNEVVKEEPGVDVDMNTIVTAIANIMFGQEQLTTMVQRVFGEVDYIKSIIGATKTNVDIMNDKLKLIEDDLVDVREKCVQGMRRYAGIKYGKITGTTIQFAYNDIYEKFNEVYNVNLYSIQNALIHSYNLARHKKGESPISFINPNKDGLRVIDVVKRLGMITELYLLINKTIQEYCVENGLNIEAV